MKTKTLVRNLIIVYSLLRLLQAITYLSIHLILHQKIISPSSALAFTVVICSTVLLTGAFGESEVLLEVWMVWTVLKFGAMIFSVFNLDFEKDTFLPNSLLVNVTISSSELNIYFQQKLKNIFLVLQMLVLGLVLKLHKILSITADEYDNYVFDCDGETSRKSFSTVENFETADAVAFEPSLFTNLMIH
jgi:hypothetical protein